MLIKTILSNFSYVIRSPLDPQLFKNPQSLQHIKTSLQNRYRDPSIAHTIQHMFQQHKKNLYKLEQLNKQINLMQKKIKQQMIIIEKNQDKKQYQELQRCKREIKRLKNQQKQQQKYLKLLGEELELNIFKVGNIVDRNTPISNNQENNQIIDLYQSKRIRKMDSIPYSELCQRAGITDLRRGQKVCGHRGYFMRGNGVKLAIALTQYGVDFLEKRGYSLYQSPAIITEQVLKASCQLQSISQDVYKLQDDNPSYLIATSEQTLAGYYKGQLLQKKQLPIRMGGYSTCFRKQAGAHGKDIHGLFRVHQFQKIEQFVITEAEEQKSMQQMKRMMEISKQFYRSLDIPFRVVNIVSGQLNDAATCKYDLQAWFPSQKRYRQLVSVSNCTDYQSRLLKVQYLDGNNQMRFPHMLNGTLIAIQRAITCILENYSHDDEDERYIEIPEVLQDYVKCERFVYK